MNSFTLIPARMMVALGALLVLGTLSAFGQQNLKIKFVPEKLVDRSTQTGFDDFPVPQNFELEPGPPVTKTFGQVSVTISGYGKEIPRKIPTDNGPLIVRYRSLSKEQEEYRYSRLFRSWVGAPHVLSIGFKGLKPSTKYKVQFYVYDYTSPDATDEKRGTMTMNNALHPSEKPLSIAWNKTLEPSKGSNDAQVFTMEATTNSLGDLLFAGVRGEANPILNAVEVSEVP